VLKKIGISSALISTAKRTQVRFQKPEGSCSSHFFRGKSSQLISCTADSGPKKHVQEITQVSTAQMSGVPVLVLNPSRPSLLIQMAPWRRLAGGNEPMRIYANLCDMNGLDWTFMIFNG
jgi:hypothetical protein